MSLCTRYGKNLNPDQIHQEYPRPNMVRDSYYCLNGMWDYAINQSREVEHYDGTILVPFAPETQLSGVERIVTPEDYLHYRRMFTLPEHFVRDRVLLHFGAVDQECEVFLNGQKLGEHQGGYLPFVFDITDVLKPQNNELTLIVCDWTEQSPHARGKQKYRNKGHMSSIFYTPSSGIWKTVWLESVPRQYIERLKLTPQYDEARLDFQVETNDNNNIIHYEVEISFDGKCIFHGKMDSNASYSKIPIPELHPWTPETPNLYQIRIQYGEDVVNSYFGMRIFTCDKDANGIMRFYLNHKPYFFSGVLDQGYWPESLLTPPTDEALEYDIVKMKELGFNTIRKHVKIESERFYYHCDRLGMIVWQDMPNGGGNYDDFFVTYFPNAFSWFGRSISDKHYGFFKRRDKEGREQYRKDLEEMVELLYNYPSIALWTPFNEGWGQFDATEATALVRKTDSTRLINEACGWFDQGGGDVYSIHNYLHKLKISPKSDRVVALTEFGGYAYPIANHMYSAKEFGYKDYKTKEELSAAFERLYETDVYSNLEKGLSATIYTQTSDIEAEINGILTYDREVVKMDETTIKRVNQRLFEKFHTIVEKKCSR